MAAGRDDVQGMAPSAKDPAGLLTRTLVHSPVIHRILHARLRHRNLNDVVFVGDDFIVIKELMEDGHLRFLARKDDFNARICAADILSMDGLDGSDELAIKREYGVRTTQWESSPPQVILVTLDTNDLLVIALAQGKMGELQFMHQRHPIPTFHDILFQPGLYIAVDPLSRAVAVSANEREVMLYAIKTKEEMQEQLSAANPDWTPIAAQRLLRVDGAIQHMAYLRVPDDDDRVVLLLIVVEHHKIKAMRIEWHEYTDLALALPYPSLPLGSAVCVPDLLIPIQNAGFLLISGPTVERYEDILSGSVTLVDDDSHDDFGEQPLNDIGASPRLPVWSSWCWAERHPLGAPTFLYLAREDGVVASVIVTGRKLLFNYLATLDCLIGSAFAFIGALMYSDIIAVVGDMSNGYLVSVESLPVEGDLFAIKRGGVLEVDIVEMIPNWASVTDMIATTFPPGRTKRPRDTMFTTSGRQPFGAITEMRYGLEARLTMFFDLLGLQSVSDLWALQSPDSNSILVLLSAPSSTRVLALSVDGDSEDVEELEASTVTLDLEHRTLLAATLLGGVIVQVTENSISTYAGVAAVPGLSTCFQVEPSSTILSADVFLARSLIVTIQRSLNLEPQYSMVIYQVCLPTSTDHTDSVPQITILTASDLPCEPLCVKFTEIAQLYVLVSTVNHRIEVFSLDISDTVIPVSDVSPPKSDEGQCLCDYIDILGDSEGHSIFVVCGLRDGRIYSFGLEHNMESGTPQILGGKITYFSHTPVRLRKASHTAGSKLYAMSEFDFCMISWDGLDLTSLSIQNIWITDKDRPHFAQGTITAYTQFPNPSHQPPADDLAESLLMISGSTLLIADVSQLSGSVPRLVPVSGSPTRLIYAEQQRCVVAASLRYGARSFPMPQRKAEERRQVWPVIDFLPINCASPSYTFDMQPGERVYSLLEWSIKLDEGKTYSFVLVGGSYRKSNGREKGRIVFLQPLTRNWEVYDVNEGRRSSFEEPVYALALWDNVTYVACSGHHVHMYRFSPEETKWQALCEPLRISSVGISITVEQPRIHISTAQDSLVVLILTMSLSDRDEAEYEYKLEFDYAAPQAAALLGHVKTISAGQMNEGLSKKEVVLATTKYGQIVGFKRDVVSNEETVLQSADIVFEAQLLHSLTRIRRCQTRPPWQPELPSGVIDSNLIGCSTDGRLVGIALLSDDLYRRLSWLQRLCEWSERICPHTHEVERFSTSEPTVLLQERAMPLGLASGCTDEMLMVTTRSEATARHVDGDILARILDYGGVEILKSIISEVAEREDRVGAWVREHLDEEISAVDETVALLKALLTGWL